MPTQTEQIAQLRRDLLDLTIMTEGVGDEWEDKQGRKHTLYSLAHGALALAQQIFDSPHPMVVCLCGSTRFSSEFREARLRESLAGNIVLTLGSDTQTDTELGLSADQIEQLADRHLYQIDMADEVLVINPGGYIGDHTRREIAYANEQHKVIRYLVDAS